ncbi:MAG: DUF2807 domain-containing protein [Bacteroidales bacterium]|nr:DUF2807 domain-containing protein [Bacteroidales bacterium]
MKRPHFFYLFLFSGIFTFFSSCINCIDATGETKTKELQLASFEELEISLPAIVSIRVGQRPAIRVTAPGNVFKSLRTPVRGKTLEIGASPCVNSNNNDIRIQLTVVSLSSIEINGPANVSVYDSLQTDKLKLSINGSGKLLAAVFTNRLDFKVNGSGEAVVNGATQKLMIKINGSGDFRGLGLKAYEAKVTINGSGNADVHVLNRLRVSVMGSGDLSYAGNPQIKSDISGSGSVIKTE